MKRMALLTVMMVGLILPTYSQDSIVLYIADYPANMVLCINQHQTVIVYAEPDCNEYVWQISGVMHWENPIVIQTPSTDELFSIDYYGCAVLHHDFYVYYEESRVPNSNSQMILKRQGLPSPPLVPVGYDPFYGNDSIEWFNYQWSTGETTPTIEVIEAGTYTCEISDRCDTATRTFIVKDNVEATLATTDLATNLNMVTWQTTDEQAEYVSQVKVYRDGALVGTAPYTDGSFTDNIGSEAASRTYTVLAVAPDGTDCPILSHPKETIHMTYTLGVGNTIVIGWNHPTGYELAGYNICEWNPNAKDDGLTVIDYVGAGVSSYTCSESQFDHGMIVVQGVERTKAAESRLLSNRSLDYVGIGEKENKFFNLYPNPTTSRVTIEGTGRLTITNTLGQTILTRDITDTETIDLPMGVWFVKLNETTRKVVVE